MISPSRVLITGATGAVGPLVAKAFHEAGYLVRTFSLDPPPAVWPEDIDTRIGDVTDSKELESAMEGVDSVVHLAALLHIANPSPDLAAEYERVNVGGTAAVVEVALKSQVRRVVFFSTIAVYGPSGGAILTEESPVRPVTLYGRSKRAAENVVLSARRADGSGLGTVLRLGAVYGARVKGNYQRLLRALSRGRFVAIGQGSNRRTLVYDKDVARAALSAAQHEKAAGKVFNVTDGRLYTLREIIEAICGALGRRYPVLSLPAGPVRWAAGIVEDGAKLSGYRPPITREAIDTYREDVAVDGRRIQRELEFMPRYDLAAGWKDAVEELQRIGEL